MLARFIRGNPHSIYWHCPTELTLRASIPTLVTQLSKSPLGYADYTFDKGPTALYFAALFGHRFIAEILLLAGANKEIAIQWAQKIPDPKWKSELKRESTSVTIQNLRPRPEALFVLLEWCIVEGANAQKFFEYLCSKTKTEVDLVERKDSDEKINLSQHLIKQLIQLAVNKDRGEMEKVLQKLLPVKYACIKENIVQIYPLENSGLYQALNAGDVLVLMRYFSNRGYSLTNNADYYYKKYPDYFALLMKNFWSEEGFVSTFLKIDSENRGAITDHTQEIPNFMKSFGRALVNEMRQFFYERYFGRGVDWEPISLPTPLQSFFVSQGIQSPRLTHNFQLTLREKPIPSEATKILFSFFDRIDLAKVARVNWAFCHHQHTVKDLLFKNKKLLKIRRQLAIINQFLVKETELAKSWRMPLPGSPAAFIAIILLFYMVTNLAQSEIPWKTSIVFLLITGVLMRSDRFHFAYLNQLPVEMIRAVNTVAAECPGAQVRDLRLGEFLQNISRLKTKLETEKEQLERSEVEEEAKANQGLRRGQ